MIIIGAGYSGLLAGCIFPDAEIYEANSEEECAEKHQAVFRMRSNKIAEYLGIEFKKVKVHKGIWFNGPARPDPHIIHMYSKKVSGTISSRSIDNIDTEIRYIPPDNFYNILLRKSCEVKFNQAVKLNEKKSENGIISTIPLQLIIGDLDSLNINIGHMLSKPIYVNRFKLKNCNSYSTVYYPHPDYKIYRATINGDILIVESIRKMDKNDAEFYTVFSSMGIDDSDIKKQPIDNHINYYGKITEIPNKIRAKMILDLTLKHNIYSLGRYATWRPRVMLDDVFDDIFVIRRLMEHGNYASILYEQEQ